MTIRGRKQGSLACCVAAAAMALAIASQPQPAAAAVPPLECVPACFEKTWSFADDVLGNGVPDPGDTVRYQVTLCHEGGTQELCMLDGPCRVGTHRQDSRCDVPCSRRCLHEALVQSFSSTRGSLDVR